jgi:hypothetical protein
MRVSTQGTCLQVRRARTLFEHKPLGVRLTPVSVGVGETPGGDRQSKGW